MATRVSRVVGLLGLLPLMALQPGTGLSAQVTEGNRAAAPAAPSAATGGLDSVLITDVPHLQQKPDFCGEACLAMALRKLGHAVDQEDVFDRGGINPMAARGAWTAELALAASSYGFRTGKVWFRVDANDSVRQLDALFQAMHADLKRGVPSIVCMRYDERPNTTEHFRLVLGYDARADEVVYHEPAEPEGAYRRMKRATFLGLWPLERKSVSWPVIRIALESHRIENRPANPGIREGDLAQHLMKLRAKVPQKWRIGLARPFFVIVEDPAALAPEIELVDWVLSSLRKEYIAVTPDAILDVWLYDGARSYTRNVTRIFGEPPTTPYGFFSPETQALYMDIKTGGGTLVHELVHPYMRTAFPECPSWFDEGLASLYERCEDRGGRIWGLPNWRLTGLREVIQKRLLPTFSELVHTSRKDFYASPTGYPQARYLCLYLQEKGLLRRFFLEFLANHDKDPSGWLTLQKVLGNPDMRQFQKDWEAWVMSIDPRDAYPRG